MGNIEDKGEILNYNNLSNYYKRIKIKETTYISDFILREDILSVVKQLRKKIDEKTIKTIRLCIKENRNEINTENILKRGKEIGLKEKISIIYYF